MSLSNNDALHQYIEEIQAQFLSGQAREHGYRPAFERLMRSFEDVGATNDPKRSEYGNPDLILYKKSNHNIILGYAEAKDVTVNLDKIVKTEQLRRYAGYEKLFLTNYLDFRFYRNGEEYESISIGKIVGGQIEFQKESIDRLLHELQAFIELPPESIRSGKRLALIMGAKARRIRDNVSLFLREEKEQNAELEKLFEMMKQLLVHDLSIDNYADMYAQTLVYGLFVARYNDTSPDDFNRREARDLVPKSNPFLQKFFDHIVGPDFDVRLSHIVDELCEVFSVSDVNALVHKHLRLFELENEKDPIIHFYEDFLKEYDPVIRKKMGAYYTPVPVVQFIVRQVDEILKRDFGITKGLADTSKVSREIDHGQQLQIRNKITGRLEKTSIEKREFHRVQVLDPAVGTATFLNETIKHIHNSFKGQQGLWESYVQNDLLPRIHGFELMMAPYTIAHLKLGMTLQETGVKGLNQRLGVYLTNTLEEGVPNQQSLFAFGLAQAITEEGRIASEIKHDRPIMVVMGNPPYSVSSNNKSNYIEKLLADYKKELNERNIQPLSDDYIKFIRFAEEMIAKNGEGIMAMITNNSYLDGLIHRQMRKHLLQTFNKIYVLNLHGSTKKLETVPGGGKDENIFDIQQGVSIIVAVKSDTKKANEIGKVYYTEIYGSRKSKFFGLNQVIDFTEIENSGEKYLFVKSDLKQTAEYTKFISLNDLFIISGTGIKFRKDNLLIKNNWSKDLAQRMTEDMVNKSKIEILAKYDISETSDWKLDEQRDNFASTNDGDFREVQYRPLDYRWTYYPLERINKIIPRGDSRHNLMRHFIDRSNTGIVYTRRNRGLSMGYFFTAQNLTDLHLVDSAGDSMVVSPLYLYHDDGTRTPNFKSDVLKEFTKKLFKAYEPEDILDYIYAVLHSPKYREKYKEFLKIDFPRVPAPKNDVQFKKLGALGKQLRELHLMKSPVLDSYDTTFPESGTDEVEKVKYEDSKVWINDTQYFGEVPKLAWNFYIGGYQPAQKWLKDRKGRKLTNEDIEHYQKILKVLVETHKIMAEIDDIKV